MNHLEAFTSDDGKRGRRWVSDGYGERYRRHGDKLQIFIDDDWLDCSMPLNDVIECTVTWANEPKALTPQEALRALADGKCLRTKDGEFFLMREGGRIATFAMTRNGSDFVEASIGDLSGCVIVPDPSQPAEPRSEWNPLGKYEDIPQDIQEDIKTERGWAKHEPAKPPLKVGDRVKRRWYATKDVGRVVGIDFTKGDDAIQVEWSEGTGAYPNDADLVLVEAEPQVEYPLSFGEAMVAMENGSVVNSELHPSITYGPHRLGMEQRIFRHETSAKWRIVEPAKEGK